MAFNGACTVSQVLETEDPLYKIFFKNLHWLCSYSTDAQTIDQQVTFDEGEPGLIPCRPAHPKFNVTLERKTPREVLSMTCTNYVTICNTTKVDI